MLFLSYRQLVEWTIAFRIETSGKREVTAAFAVSIGSTLVAWAFFEIE